MYSFIINTISNKIKKKEVEIKLLRVGWKRVTAVVMKFGLKNIA